ncbi:probable myosin-binding protein 5 [Prosopis cineraria]|uniref:probable myosin-binding protein 5 n=1 Tax=Prosopis cineraria TaxID=364024 RepID=UPI002410AC62|nr:probable myosin-binding protein 5 [Prosopis cineraria]
MATRSFSRYVEEELGKIPHFMIFAVFEWVLIILLFIDGLLAFAANEFARFFELKIPCLLCTRLDHVLVHRNPDFYYNDSVCESHKKDVSCLAFCHNHRKLSDIKKMCESCLLSFATEKESDCDTYKSLVGILHKDLECFVEDDQQIQLSLRDDGMPLEKSSTQKCSCCGKPLRAKSSYPKGKSSYSHAPVPSPRAHPHTTSRNEESRGLELPQTPRTRLTDTKISDSEATEDVDGYHGNHSQDAKSKEDLRAASGTEGEEEPNKTPTFTRGNKFFGIPLADAANYIPRSWSFKPNKKSSLEKTDLSGDSTEGHGHFEAEDAILNHLKRHVRLDRKSLMALYMELDEERSASAVAANNAMAMITRLQAEKAAVQMEALQYQRMMEEQAEYDEEALQAASEMLMRREDEIKALEAELAIYREKYGCLSEDDFKDIMRDLHEDSQEFRFQPYLSHQGSTGSPPMFSEGEDNEEKGHKFHQAGSAQMDSGGARPSESLRDIKGDKSHLLNRIKKLDTRNHIVDNGFQFPQFSSDSSSVVQHGTDKASEASLTSLTDIVKALEADSKFLELVGKQHEEQSEESEILTAISENLEKLKHLVMNSPKTSPKACPVSDYA